MLSTGKLLSLLPLGVVVVQGRRQNGIREESTAGTKASRDKRYELTILLLIMIG